MNISHTLEIASALPLASPTAVSWRARLDLVAPGPGSLLALSNFQPLTVGFQCFFPVHCIHNCTLTPGQKLAYYFQSHCGHIADLSTTVRASRQSI